MISKAVIEKARSLRFGSGEAPIRVRYRDCFDSCFVYFKPFLAVPDSVLRISSLPHPRELHIFDEDAEAYEDLMEQISLQSISIEWSEILTMTGIHSPSKIEQGLETLEGALKSEFRDAKVANIIRDYCIVRNILTPQDNLIYPVESVALLSVFETMELNTVIVSDEFMSELSEMETERLRRDVWPHSILHPDLDFYIHPVFDKFAIFIHCSEAMADLIRNSDEFEGFFCNEMTTIDWWLDPENQIGELKLKQGR